MFEIKMQSDGHYSLSIYGLIGSGPGADVDANQLAQELEGISPESLTIRINSVGGSVFDALGIRNRIESMQIPKITTICEGLCASAATLIYLLGHERHMQRGSRFMIHQSRALGVGTADELRTQADQLEVTNREALDIYEQASTKPRQAIEKAMAAETWLDANETLEWGFATHATSGFAVAACWTPNAQEFAAKFAHTPEEVAKQLDDKRRREESQRVLDRLSKTRTR